MSVTKPWSRLYIYEGATAEADALAFIRYVASGRFSRRRARITRWWFEDDGQVLDGPIVPEAERASL